MNQQTVKKNIVIEKSNLIAGDAYARSYYEERIKQAGPHERILYPFMFKHIGDVRGNKIVDLGCGHGKLIEELVPLNPQCIVGVDINPDLLAGIEQKHFSRVSVICSDIATTLPFPEKHFDIAILNQVLLHLDEMRLSNLLTNLKRILVPNGKVIATVTHFDWAISMYKFQSISGDTGWTDRNKDGLVYREWFRNEARYRSIFEQEGFSVEIQTLLVPNDSQLELRYREQVGKPIFHAIEAIAPTGCLA